MMRAHIILMAGGAGERLWPLSTRSRPKQFVSIDGLNHSLMQHMFELARALAPAERIWVSTRQRYRAQVATQLPELSPDHILCEPATRGTCAATVWVAHLLADVAGDDPLLFVATDQLIGEPALFIMACQEALDVASRGDFLVNVGTPASAPNPHFGYMLCGEPTGLTPRSCFGHRYHEKPPVEIAQEYLAGEREVLWGCNVFAWRTEPLMRACIASTRATHPRLDELLAMPAPLVRDAYLDLPTGAIDHVILERMFGLEAIARNVFVRSEHTWTDLGSFRAWGERLSQDTSGNLSSGEVAFSGASRCLGIARAPYALRFDGVEGVLAVISRDGDALVAPREHMLSSNQLTTPTHHLLARSERGLVFVAEHDRPPQDLAMRLPTGGTLLVRGAGLFAWSFGENALEIRPTETYSMPRAVSNVALTVAPRAEDLDELVAARVIEVLRARIRDVGHVSFSPSCGSTPLGVYRVLRERYREAIDWGAVTLVQMDEFCDVDPSRSYLTYLQQELVEPLGIACVIPCAGDLFSAWSERVGRSKGLDLCLHGLGINGHLGFNEPGTPWDMGYHEVELSEATRVAASVRFSPGDPPRRGMTLGLGQLAKARQHIFLVTGDHKRRALTHALFRAVDPSCPASLLQSCEDVDVYVDRAALGHIERVTDGGGEH